MVHKLPGVHLNSFFLSVLAQLDFLSPTTSAQEPVGADECGLREHGCKTLLEPHLGIRDARSAYSAGL